MNTGINLPILDQQDVRDCAASGLWRSIQMCPLVLCQILHDPYGQISAWLLV